MFKPLLSITLTLAANTSLAETKLIFSYWTDASEPFVFAEDGKLQKGIIKEIGDEVSRRLGAEPIYIQVPVKRLETQLIFGKVHIDCITNPFWKETPDNYHWSPVLFKGSDRFLVKKGNDSDINSFTDLKGKHVGIYNGYTYHADIMGLFESGQATAEQVAGIGIGAKLVNLGRLDALVDFGTLLAWHIKANGYKNLTLASKHADDYDLMCAYSPKLPIDFQILDKHFTDLVNEGFVEKVLSQYR